MKPPSQERLMEGKVAVVTGAGRGIGRAIAMMMAAHGAKVVVNDLGVSLDGEGSDSTPAQEVVAEIKAAGGDAVANADSVASFSGGEKIIQCALDNFGKIDAVVNNAGVLRDVNFTKMSEDDWDTVVNVMLKGAFNVSRHAATHFKAQSSGAFVHMTSTSGLIGGLGQANYGAAKLGMVALSKSIALDMARWNVRSNCIAPVAWTRMTESVPVRDAATAARIESRKAVTAEHNAPLAVFLASDAAKDVNAQIFTVRKNEVFLLTQPRVLRAIHRSEGWTPEDCRDHLLPAFRNDFYPVQRSADVFTWSPI